MSALSCPGRDSFRREGCSPRPLEMPMGSVSSPIPEKAWAKCLDSEAGSSASEIVNAVTRTQQSTNISDQRG